MPSGRLRAFFLGKFGLALEAAASAASRYQSGTVGPFAKGLGDSFDSAACSLELGTSEKAERCIELNPDSPSHGTVV